MLIFSSCYDFGYNFLVILSNNSVSKLLILAIFCLVRLFDFFVVSKVLITAVPESL